MARSAAGRGSDHTPESGTQPPTVGETETGLTEERKRNYPEAIHRRALHFSSIGCDDMRRQRKEGDAKTIIPVTRVQFFCQGSQPIRTVVRTKF